MSRRVLIFDTPDEIGSAVAQDIAARMASSLAARPGLFLLGCPGGRSPRPVYAELARLAGAQALDLSRLIIVMMDDYLTPAMDHVPDDAHYSCRRFARDEILAVLNAALAPSHRIPDGNLWFPDPANPAAYDGRIAAAGGIDLFLLASGAGDGHVAFNPPGAVLASRTRIVALAQQTRRDNLATFPNFASIDQVPTHGVTVGIATIAEARASAMLVWGADKRIAFQNLAQATTYDPRWPASVWASCPDTTLYADHAAAGGTP
jgi:glucosamine-6-phosphate deaminase